MPSPKFQRNPNDQISNFKQNYFGHLKLELGFLHFEFENFFLTFCPLTPSLSPAGRGEGCGEISNIFG
jgi:hypothetical protein